ncbi:MAG: bifunctional oligoribonuclease/PAP phosphatase NrnA [Candidatus Margulisbacteria bacterium]|nr:bifunctional oligoribonuclease/PAP phosphatase NrnA [Candidatus Margulisiibacteriota bacterium]
MRLNPKIVTQLQKKIAAARSILLLAHEFPDGDAFGSVAAMNFVLKHMKKKVDIAYLRLDNSSWDYLYFFKGLNIHEYSELAEKKYDLAIILDSSNENRLGEQKVLLSRCSFVINIDHHPDNSEFGDLNLLHWASAVGEILYFLFKKMKVDISRETAICLLISIITDTGRFKHSSTHRGIFKVIYEILKFVEPDDYYNIVQHLYSEVSLKKSKLIREALNNLEIFGKNIAFSYIPEDTGLEEGLVDNILSIKGIGAAVLARRVGKNIKLSLRAKDKTLNVRELAAQFNGGGHIHASGASMQLQDLPKQIEEIRQKVKKYFNKK